MAATANFTDSEGKTWDFTGVNPISTRFSGQIGQGVLGGTADAYDGGLALALGFDLTGFGNATLVNPVVGSIDEAGRELNTRPVLLGGIAVTRSALVSDSSISSLGFCRLLDSFTNTTDQTVTIRVQLVSNVGSDAATAVVGETSGNGAIDITDRGFVTDEFNNQSGGDSSVGFVYGDGVGQRPIEARPTLVSGEFTDQISVVYDLTLAPGETQRLLSYAFQNTTAAQGIADVTQFDDALAVLDRRGLLAGISDAERAQIVNYSENGAPPRGLTVSNGSGQGWILNTDTGSIQTLGNDALRSTRFALDSNIFDSFVVPVSSGLAEAGQEANTLLRTSFGSLGGATIGYSLMASPDAHFARLAITLTAGTAALDFRGDTVGLFASLGTSILVGDRDLVTGQSDLQELITDSGVVLDDSVSGAGGRNPALSVGFGDFDLGKPVGREDAVKLAIGELRVTDGDFLVAAGTSHTLLFFFGLNDDAGPGLADLARFSTPGFEELAGLSAAEVAQIKNFTLTEDDRLQSLTLTSGDDVFTGNYWGEKVNGAQGNDDLLGGGSDDVLQGGLGRDFLDGGISNDSLGGGSGNDILIGGEGNDTLRGDAGNDQLFGGNGNDVGFGGDGVDTIQGGAGADVLSGDAGNDTIEGGAGIDRITGGAGADKFVFNLGFGRDRVTDYVDNVDKLDFSGHLEVDVFADLTITQDGTGVLITDGFGGQLTLDNTQVASLTATDFLF